MVIKGGNKVTKVDKLKRYTCSIILAMFCCLGSIYSYYTLSHILNDPKEEMNIILIFILLLLGTGLVICLLMLLVAIIYIVALFNQK